MKPKATELEYLKFFFQQADFGPADSEVRDYIRERFMSETGKNLPTGYNFDSEGNELIDE